jgi:type VI secretion system protein ImpG
MLGGPSSDPDVERLLEGVAFLTALLRQKLDDEFPEIVHELIQLIWPHYLRPVPASSLMAFSPKPVLKQSAVIPAGIQVASTPVEGTSCVFKTCSQVEVHPLTLLEASLDQKGGRPAAVRLHFELNGLKLSSWKPGSLNLFLAEDYPNASNLYYLLQHHLKQITLLPERGGIPLLLSPEFLKPGGFSEREALIPYPSHSFPGYRLLQEYFILPEKFLFLDLKGWERWQNRGESSKFEILFELDSLPLPPPRIRRESFLLSATPVINLFPHEADPIRLDHRKTEYLVRPSGSLPDHRPVYSIEQVAGYVQGTAEERKYFPFDFLKSNSRSHPVYHVVHKASPLEDRADVYLSVAYPPESGIPTAETLSVKLLCTNGFLPERLRAGDICQHTGSSPEYVEFKNLSAPKPYVLPPMGTNLLWRLLSHLALNYLSLSQAENLRALLELYLFVGSRDRPALEANRKRIAGIEKVENTASTRLVAGIPVRGRQVKLRAREDHFAGLGDLFLFGCILDHFLGGYAALNTFTHLFLEEVTGGKQYRWPPRIGDRLLI